MTDVGLPTEASAAARPSTPSHGTAAVATSGWTTGQKVLAGVAAALLVGAIALIGYYLAQADGSSTTPPPASSTVTETTTETTTAEPTTETTETTRQRPTTTTSQEETTTTTRTTRTTTEAPAETTTTGGNGNDTGAPTVTGQFCPPICFPAE